jgi:hypothetical protein
MSGLVRRWIEKKKEYIYIYIYIYIVASLSLESVIKAYVFTTLSVCVCLRLHDTPYNFGISWPIFHKIKYESLDVREHTEVVRFIFYAR